MREKTIAIAALARDCAEALERNIPRIEALRCRFGRSFVAVVENDSRDGTKGLLEKWRRDSDNVFVIEGAKQSLPPYGTPHDGGENGNPAGGFARIEKLAAYRNQYMDRLAALPEKIDFLLVIDLDIDGFDPDAVINAIQDAPEDWAALFANGVKYFSFFGKKIRTRYYDDYAVVPCTDEDSPRLEMAFDELKINRENLEKSLKKSAYTKVLSAFGGMGIYKYEYIKNERYKTGPNTRNAFFAALCEHIAVNVPLAGHGALYAVRDLLILHTRLTDIKDILLEFLPVRVWLFLYTRLKK